MVAAVAAIRSYDSGCAFLLGCWINRDKCVASASRKACWPLQSRTAEPSMRRERSAFVQGSASAVGLAGGSSTAISVVFESTPATWMTRGTALPDGACSDNSTLT